jgi:glutamate racemase
MIAGNSKQKNQQPIGIFDSGVGGLSILKAVEKLMPQENLIYLADTQYAPYGERSIEFINQRVLSIAEFLISKNIKLMIVACNTATATSIKQLREKYKIPVIGIEPAIKPAAEYSQNKKVGVLATQSTLESEKYLKLKTRFNQEVDFIEKASSLFVELVESGIEITQQEIGLIQNELKPFIESDIDSLVLGCTHFPFLAEAIQKTLGENIKLFESAMPVAYEAQRQLDNQANTEKEKGRIEYFSSYPEKGQITFESILQKSIHLKLF